MSVKGMAETIAGLRRRMDAIPKAAKLACLRQAAKIAETAMSTVPVVTGTLQASIGVVDLDDGAKVVVTAPYAGYVEFGTSRMMGRAFLGKAVAAHAGELEDEFWQALGEIAPT